MEKKEFDLEVILTMINGVNYTDDFSKVFLLADFVYGEKLINSTDLIMLSDNLKQHLLECLKKDLNRKGFYLEDNMTAEDWLNKYINYDSGRGISEELWLESLKSKLGNTIMIENKENENNEENYNYMDELSIIEKVKTRTKTFFK